MTRAYYDLNLDELIVELRRLLTRPGKRHADSNEALHRALDARDWARILDAALDALTRSPVAPAAKDAPLRMCVSVLDVGSHADKSLLAAAMVTKITSLKAWAKRNPLLWHGVCHALVRFHPQLPETFVEKTIDSTLLAGLHSILSSLNDRGFVLRPEVVNGIHKRMRDSNETPAFTIPIETALEVMETRRLQHAMAAIRPQRGHVAAPDQRCGL